LCIYDLFILMSGDKNYIPEEEEQPDDEHIPAKRCKRVKEYYTFFTNAEEKFGICKLCKSEKKKIKMTGGNTTGLNRHLKNKHPTIHEKIFCTSVSSCKIMDLFQKVKYVTFK